VEHPRWMHWAQNTDECHRVAGQTTVYLRQNDQDRKLGSEELQEMAENQGSKEFRGILGRINAFNANILGSNAYFYKEKKS
jgi:L-amino acid N-acyltransferase YncA